MDIHIPTALLTSAQVTGLLMLVALLWCVLHSRHEKITMLSLGVRGLYWFARWMQNLAVNSDKFLLQWREYRKANAIQPLNETQTRPQAIPIKKKVSAQ